MKVLIVAKTRRGAGACVGGITEQGRSVRLIAADAYTNERTGMEYEVGDVWDIESRPDPQIVPPHVENIIVVCAHKLKPSQRVEEAIHRYMPPLTGGPEKLFDGLAQVAPSGALYIAERTGLPSRSTMFWMTDAPLELDCAGKRLHYRYPAGHGARTIVFVGFQDPVKTIPAGTLLRVSLAHWWRPSDKPEEEQRCYVQLSGWFQKTDGSSARRSTLNVCHAPLSVTRGIDHARQALKQTFGFTEFLSLQADIVARVLDGKDTLAVMPTGGGKSLCYQLPALIFGGLTVVVSPLIALMEDQVRQLRDLNISAAFLNSTVAHQDYLTITNRVRQGDVKILYAAPETLLRPETLLLIEQSRLCCFAVDEAHCISEWGHDFRPEYRQLPAVRERFPRAVCLALTATATGRVRDDVSRLLGIPRDGQFVASFNRPNLFLRVEPRRDGLAQTLEFVERHRGESGIIYCSTRKKVDELAADLNANGWPALPYHAGLDDATRRTNQGRFIHDDVPLMVATIAFGMGINKSNVRFVLHYNLPKDLESYYQEIGRAGRDSLASECLLLYSRGDSLTIRHFIDHGAAAERAGREERLNAMMCFAEARECRRIPLLAYFGESLEGSCGACDNCVASAAPGQMANVTLAAQRFLSCVVRTGKIFGAQHIIAVLRGSRAQKVLSRGHDRLSTYGIGKEHSTEEWQRLAHEFVRAGLLDQDLAFGGLRLTTKGHAALKMREKVLVAAQPSSAARTREPSPAASELFQKLRDLRKQLADEAGMPAYIIFSDRALSEMAASLPQDQRQFLAINGVGEAKLAKYGQQFLQLINEHCGKHNVQPAPVPVRKILSGARQRFHQVGDLYAIGEALEAIAARFNIQRKTVIEHLHRFHQTGGQIDPTRLLSECSLAESDAGRRWKPLQRLGLERLAPIHQALAGRVPYSELHLLRLYLLASKCAGQEQDEMITRELRHFVI